MSKQKELSALQPVKYVQVLRGGTAHVILFNDGNEYVVKWYGVKKDREKEVINEYIVARLAERLSLPIIPFKLVYIPEDFLKNTPQLISKKENYLPGYHFACLYIENSIPFETVRFTPPTKDQVRNRDSLAGLTVFDQWLNNTDRGMMNVILEQFNDGTYYVHMIDHGRCFPGGYRWNSETLKNEPVYNIHWPFYKWIYTVLHDDGELTSYIDQIVQLSDEDISEIISSIPADWNVSTEDRYALFQFLLKQKKNLPSIVDSIIEKKKFYESNE